MTGYIVLEHFDGFMLRLGYFQCCHDLQCREEIRGEREDHFMPYRKWEGREGNRMGGSGFKRRRESASIGGVRTEDGTATAGAKVSFYSMAVHGDEELNTCTTRFK